MFHIDLETNFSVEVTRQLMEIKWSVLLVQHREIHSPKANVPDSYRRGLPDSSLEVPNQQPNHLSSVWC